MQRAALDSVVMASTPTGRERSVLQDKLASQVLRDHQGSSNSSHDSMRPTGVATINTPTRGERNMGLGVAAHHGAHHGDYHLQHCLALVVSQGPQVAGESLAALARILRNILASPGELKYRQIRLSNPKVQATVVDVAGALEFMEGCGFEIRFPTTTGGPEEGGADAYAVFPEATPLGYLSNGWVEITAALTAQGVAFEQLPPHCLPPPIASPSSSTDGRSNYQQNLNQQLNQLLPADSGSHTSSAPQLSQAGTPVHSHGHVSQPQWSQSQSQSMSRLGLGAGAMGASGSLPPARSRLGQESYAQMPVSPHSTGGGASSSERTSTSSMQVSPSAASVQQPVERNTQVVLPAAPDTEVPDWFFQRTGAEVKAEWQALAKRRADGEVLTTRAWRDRAAASSGSAQAPATATLRIRFPEGVCLQGTFGAREPLTAVFEWLTEALRYPGEMSYELITPARKPLPHGGLIRDVPDLLPAAVLNFRTMGGELTAFASVPFLSDRMLALTRAE